MRLSLSRALFSLSLATQVALLEVVAQTSETVTQTATATATWTGTLTLTGTGTATATATATGGSLLPEPVESMPADREAVEKSQMEGTLADLSDLLKRWDSTKVAVFISTDTGLFAAGGWVVVTLLLLSVARCRGQAATSWGS